MDRNLAVGAYPLPRGLGKNPKRAFEIVSRLENTKEKVFDRLFKEYFEKFFRKGGRCYSPSMCGEANEIFSIGYRRPCKVSLKVFDCGDHGRTEFMISGTAFWEKNESKKFEWISIYCEEDAVAYARQAKKFFNDLEIEVSLKIELED